MAFVSPSGVAAAAAKMPAMEEPLAVGMEDDLCNHVSEMILKTDVLHWQWQIKGASAEDPFVTFLGCRLQLAKGAVIDLAQDVEASAVDGGMVLEVWVKSPAGFADPKAYYDGLKDEHLDKIIACGGDKEAAKAIQEESSQITVCEMAERAAIDELRNKYKDNFGWRVHRTHLPKQCKPKLVRLDVDKNKKDEEKAESIVIHLEVEQTDVYVAKKKASLAKKATSP